MQAEKSFIVLVLFCMCFFNCSSKKEANTLNTTTALIDTVIIRDTIYLDKESSISDDLYFSINSIYNGNYWEKEYDDEYWYFYKILLSSIGERKYIYVEKIQIIDDSKVKMIKRTKIPPSIFGRDSDYYYHSPALIDWISPTIVKLLIEKKEYNLDISKMKIVK